MEHQGGSHSDYGAKLRLSHRSGTGPDIVHEPHDVNLTSLMSAGFTAPAPDYIVAIIEQETIAQNAMMFQHLDGDPEKPIHAALITWQCQQYLYNRDYLMEAGLPERGAVDRDEFRDWAKKLTVRDANGNMVRAGYTFKMPNPHWHMSPWVFGAGGTYLNADQSAAAVTTPEGRAAWERAMQYIYDITWEDGSGDFGAGNPRELFWNGDVAIHAEGIYEIANRDCQSADCLSCLSVSLEGAAVRRARGEDAAHAGSVRPSAYTPWPESSTWVAGWRVQGPSGRARGQAHLVWFGARPSWRPL